MIIIITTLALKHLGNNISLNGSPIIVLDIYDGAEHHRAIHKKRTTIISFSSQLFCLSTLESGATPAQSFNILTWQQMEGTECAKTLFPAI